MHRTRVKICGVTSPEDAQLAARLGADAVGMILHAPGARREIDTTLARRVCEAMPPYVTTVGVFRDAINPRIRQTLAHVPLSAVQLHGKEGLVDARGLQPIPTIKVLPADGDLGDRLSQWAGGKVPNLSALLIDSAAGGGSGVPSNWDTVAEALAGVDRATFPPLVLAGGLTPETVYDVIRRFRPWAVDVSSGVEEHGRKSERRITDFLNAVRGADRDQ